MIDVGGQGERGEMGRKIGLRRRKETEGTQKEEEKEIEGKIEWNGGKGDRQKRRECIERSEGKGTEGEEEEVKGKEMGIEKEGREKRERDECRWN